MVNWHQRNSPFLRSMFYLLLSDRATRGEISSPWELSLTTKNISLLNIHNKASLLVFSLFLSVL
jgi:hypothetical protein